MKQVKNATGYIVLIVGGIAIAVGSLLLWALMTWSYWNLVMVAQFSGLPSFTFSQSLIICAFISILLGPVISSNVSRSKN